jgi:hypothetical protein
MEEVSMSISQKELDGSFQRFAAPLVNGEAAKRFGEPVAKQLAQTFWHMMIQGPMSEAHLWNSFGESFTSDDVAMLRRCFEEEMKPSLSLAQLTGLGEWYLKGEERQFAVGDHVRVRHGTVDPDYSDLPLGGWCGTITELGEEGYCSVKLSRQTLDQIHPVYKRRCERDGVDAEYLSVYQEDLDPDFGEDLPLEKPTSIQTKPLDAKEFEDRIRAALGLTTDDAIPAVGKASLLKYFEYLKANLAFPFRAEYSYDDGRGRIVRKISVIGMCDEFPIDDEYGLVCRVTDDQEQWEVPVLLLELLKQDRNERLLEDYRRWYDDWKDDDQFARTEELSGKQEPPEDYEPLENDRPLRRQEQSPTLPVSKKVGRNDPCPCGSGKKFKKCCLNKRQAGGLLD